MKENMTLASTPIIRWAGLMSLGHLCPIDKLQSGPNSSGETDHRILRAQTGSDDGSHTAEMMWLRQCTLPHCVQF